MGHLKDFVLDPGHDYRRLQPASDTQLGDSSGDMHSLAVAEDKGFALGFFTTGYPATSITGLLPDTGYDFEWWHVERGGWQKTTEVKSDKSGVLKSPPVPDPSRNWAYRIKQR